MIYYSIHYSVELEGKAQILILIWFGPKLKLMLIGIIPGPNFTIKFVQLTQMEPFSYILPSKRHSVYNFFEKCIILYK